MTDTDSLLDPKALEEVPDEEIEERLLNRPIQSLRDLQYTYGSLITLAVAGQGEYAEYYTPTEARDLIDEPQSLISVRVDVTGEEPEFAGVKVQQYKKDMANRVAPSRYLSGKNGIDHSLTHQSGQGSNPGKLAGYAQDRLTDWPTKSPVQKVKGEHPDGHLIQALETLGEDESVVEAVYDEVEEKVEEKRTSLVTVEILRDEENGWEYPGEVEVFNEALRERKLGKYTTKGRHTTDSRGPAVDYVTGEEATAVGTPESPLNFFKTKQLEKFEGFDPDASWAIHPISEDTAVNIDKSNMVLDDLSDTIYGEAVYYLPYLAGTMSAEDAKNLYSLLAEVVESADDDDRNNPVEEMYESIEWSQFPADRLRFHLLILEREKDDVYNVFHENMSASFMATVDVADAHQQALESWLFSSKAEDGSNLFTTKSRNESESILIDPEADYVGSVSSGRYLKETMSTPDGDSTEIYDPAYRVFSDVMSGQSVQVETLLDLFVAGLCDDGTEMFSSNWYNQVATQWAQLAALASEDQLVTKDSTLQSFTEPPEYMTGETDADASDFETREAMLEQFIDDHPPLRDQYERRSAFLLGALIGHLSDYQRDVRNVGQTMADNNPVNSLTKTNFGRKVTNAVEKSQVYASDDGYGSMLFSEVIDRLVDDVQKSEIQDWDITREDLRFHYGLGVAYGKTQYAEQSDN